MIVLIHGLNLCGDWTQYKDIKCVKVLKEMTTEEEALEKCLELDPTSTLLTINDQGEQEFLNELLVEFRNISTSAWIGMKYKGIEYKWMDGSDADFTNWSEFASVWFRVEDCVQMSLMREMLGKWTDMSCKKTALVVCQKRQEINFNSLKDIIKSISEVFEAKNNELRNEILKNNQEHAMKLEIMKNELEIQKLNMTLQFEHEKMTNERRDSEFKELIKDNESINRDLQTIKDIKENYIPLGFLYTQFPNQSSPLQIWPAFQWKEITNEYSGLFFRVEGSGSEPFGKIQQANQSYISDIKAQSVIYSGWRGAYKHYFNQTSLNKIGGNWNDLNPSHVFDRMWFFMTSSEVRPKNTAIKIWKRI